MKILGKGIRMFLRVSVSLKQNATLIKNVQYPLARAEVPDLQ